MIGPLDREKGSAWWFKFELQIERMHGFFFECQNTVHIIEGRRFWMLCFQLFQP